MSSADIIAQSDAALFQVYARIPLALVRGEGTRVWDGDGRTYLDFFSSTVVTALGHSHPAITRAIETQARKILHVSNLHYSEPQARLAQLLVKHSFADRVFLCNSGAEANEAAIKLARRYGQRDGGGRYEVLTALGSFHGRTLATITATGQEKTRVGFEPLPRGFRYVPFDDVAAVADAVSGETIAVMVEPVQGEGGIRVPHPEYLRELRALCDRRNLLLILDEVQTGMGRTGPLFAYQHSGISPDIMTLAKGLGGGLPIGAMLATQDVAQAFTVGSHASTFGGNALTSAAAVAVLETMVNEGVLANCETMGERLRAGLTAMRGKHDLIKDVRGQGLLVGAELTIPAAEIVERCLQRGLIINGTAQTVLRFAPPLTVTAAEVDEALAIVDQALRQ